ncbi:hypothetical protein FB451DRAFT_1176883 [Mycena latifolia]|nr:hypothetical protein FB451DRAFT_1176883 [Mycena latifolia]
MAHQFMPLQRQETSEEESLHAKATLKVGTMKFEMETWLLRSQPGGMRRATEEGTGGKPVSFGTEFRAIRQCSIACNGRETSHTEDEKRIKLESNQTMLHASSERTAIESNGHGLAQGAKDELAGILGQARRGERQAEGCMNLYLAYIPPLGVRRREAAPGRIETPYTIPCLQAPSHCLWRPAVFSGRGSQVHRGGAWLLGSEMVGVEGAAQQDGPWSHCLAKRRVGAGESSNVKFKPL